MNAEEQTNGAEPAERDRVGTTLQDRYRILDALAQGGMGVVYRGQQIQLNRPVAIKFLNASFAANPESQKRFERELRAMSRLNHPNCVSVIDFGIADSPYIVMEYVTGRTLKDVLAEEGRLLPARALYITSQILAALAHAHSQDMVHRDIKPANIILADTEGTLDHVYVLDFGLAKFLSSAAGDELTASWMVLGTPSYMSPEQARGDTIHASTDIYSTGVLLFELLTGSKPFQADNAFETLQKHQSAPIPSIRERAPDAELSPELDALVRRALAKEPRRRFPGAAAFAEALDAVPEAAAPPRASSKMRALTKPEGSWSDASGPPDTLGPHEAGDPPDTLGPHEARAAPDTLGSHEARAARATPAPRRASDDQDALAATVASGANPASPGARAEPTATSDSAAETEVPAVRRWAVRAVLVAVLLAAAAIASWQATLDEDSGGEQVAAATSPGEVRPQDGEPGAPARGAASDQRGELDQRGEPDQRAEPDQRGEPDQHTEPDQRGEPPPSNPSENTASAAGNRPAQRAASATGNRPAQRSPQPASVKTIRDVERLVDQGRREAAIQGIVKLRRTDFPNSAYLAYLLGNLYFDKLWWSDGLDAYSDAIRLKRDFRRNATLNKNAIRALSHNKARRKAFALYLKQIRRAGLKYLRAAARSDKNPVVRRRAKYLIGRITRR